MNWSEIDGWFDFEDIYDQAIARAAESSVFVEVGAWQGRSTAYMASRIKDSGKKIAFYVVDLWESSSGYGLENVFSIFETNMFECGVRKYVLPLRESSLQAAASFADGTVDFCFIDGDHSYEAVKQDIMAWLPKVRPQGILAGHDYLDFFDRPSAKHKATSLNSASSSGVCIDYDSLNLFHYRPPNPFPGVRQAVDELFEGRFVVQGTSWIHEAR